VRRFEYSLSLFLLSPITVPLTTQAVGKEAEKVIKETLFKAIRGIGKKIANDDRLNNYHALIRGSPPKIPQKADPPSNRKTAGPSWFGKKPSIPTMIGTTELSPTELFKRVGQSVYVVIASPTLADLKSYKDFFQGSAVAISPSMALTNCHILENSNFILLLKGKQKFPSKIQFSDMDTDRCILKIEKNSLFPISGIRSYSELQVGEEVFTIGSPRGLENTLGQGLISRFHHKKNINYIQTSAPISQGSSGGGLFDNRGNLIGITTWNMKDSQNLNFAISVDEFWKEK